jgi:hypothetical protein
MKKYALIGILALSAIIFIAACANEDNKEKENEIEIDDDIDPSRIIAEGFTFENFPKIDGSTSTEPLNIILVCKLLGIKYEWLKESYGRWYAEPIIKNVVNSMKFWRLIKTSQTHQSFINLIDKEADIIRCRYGLGSRTPMSLKEIGDRFNLTKERIRQIEKNAVNRLKHPARIHKLQAYVA